MVDRMQRRVLELQGGRLIRDEASGLYRQLEQSTAEFDALLRSDDGMPIPRRAPTQRSEQELFDEAFRED
jgi:cell division transport system ATP-binding protein